MIPTVRAWSEKWDQFTNDWSHFHIPFKEVCAQ